ncbi:hypothetical protein L484_027915 [Morus notabilis]|uniref:Uncharacterized protein n=1 Tax=Morus notabilis TaxID=981085 RepID=W9S7F5_9ROSA|nr:hypothetical protein L484_027915 [Morus notabilis]
MPQIPFYANANICDEDTRLLSKVAIQSAFAYSCLDLPFDAKVNVEFMLSWLLSTIKTADQPFHAQFKALLRVDFLGGGADTGALPFPLPELEVAMSTTELAPSDWIQGASSASSSRSGSGSSKDGSHKCCGNFGKE